MDDKTFFKCSVALNLRESPRILTYQTSSDRNAAAWPSLCPDLKPEQESGHPARLPWLGTLFRRDMGYTVRLRPLCFQPAGGTSQPTTHPSRWKHWLSAQLATLWKQSRPVSLTASRLPFYSREPNHHLSSPRSNKACFTEGFPSTPTSQPRHCHHVGRGRSDCTPTAH